MRRVAYVYTQLARNTLSRIATRKRENPKDGLDLLKMILLLRASSG